MLQRVPGLYRVSYGAAATCHSCFSVHIGTLLVVGFFIPAPYGISTERLKGMVDKFHCQASLIDHHDAHKKLYKTCMHIALTPFIGQTLSLLAVLLYEACNDVGEHIDNYGLLQMGWARNRYQGYFATARQVGYCVYSGNVAIKLPGYILLHGVAGSIYMTVWSGR